MIINWPRFDFQLPSIYKSISASFFIIVNYLKHEYLFSLPYFSTGCILLTSVHLIQQLSLPLFKPCCYLTPFVNLVFLYYILYINNNYKKL